MVVFYRIGQIGRAGKKPVEPPTGRSAGLYTAQDPRAVVFQNLFFMRWF